MRHCSHLTAHWAHADALVALMRGGLSLAKWSHACVDPSR